MEDKDHYLDPCFEEILLPIYKYYTTDQMVTRMVSGMNTNNLECTNSLIWSLLG